MDGSPSGMRYDTLTIQYFPFSNTKLRHFRTITLGYTGQKIHPASRASWKFDSKQHAQVAL